MATMLLVPVDGRYEERRRGGEARRRKRYGVPYSIVWKK